MDSYLDEGKKPILKIKEPHSHKWSYARFYLG
jgi:hypothetical protein